MRNYIMKPLRPAIAMIELIFALVIMGITLLSAPLILNMSIQSSNVAMQQESIAAAASQISLVLTHPWDEGTATTITGFGILNVAAGDSELSPATRLSADTNASYSRRYNDPGLGQTGTASLPGNFGEGKDTISDNDIDDFDDVTRRVTLYSASEISKLSQNEGEYLKNNQFNLSTIVNYGNDSANYANANVQFNNPFLIAANSTNIKLVTVTLRDDTGETEHSQSITMHGFACNIGNAAPGAVPMP